MVVFAHRRSDGRRTLDYNKSSFKVIWEELRRHSSRQWMDSPAACASCAMPTADESNHSANYNATLVSNWPRSSDSWAVVAAAFNKAASAASIALAPAYLPSPLTRGRDLPLEMGKLTIRFDTSYMNYACNYSTRYYIFSTSLTINIIERKRFWSVAYPMCPFVWLSVFLPVCVSGKCIVAKRLVGSRCSLGSVEGWEY